MHMWCWNLEVIVKPLKSSPSKMLLIALRTIPEESVLFKKVRNAWFNMSINLTYASGHSSVISQSYWRFSLQLPAYNL